ncbi:TolC family protein [bacterium]|nr:TolC family protein [bacterium]
MSTNNRAAVAVFCLLFAFDTAVYCQEKGYAAFLESASFFTESSFPQETGKELQGYERILLERNPELQSQWAMWESSRKKIASVQSLPDPQLTFGHFLEPVQTAVGPQRYRYGLRQMVPWPGKLVVSGDIQKQTAEAAFNEFRSSVEALLLRFRLLYYDAWYLERILESTAKHLSLLENQEEVITVRYRSDAAVHADLIKTEIERIRIEDDLASLQTKRRTLQAEMRLLLNAAEDTDIIIADTLSPTRGIPGREALLESVRLHNPEILIASSLARRSLRRTALARLESFPDFSAGIDIIETGSRLDDAGAPVPGSGTNPVLLSGSVSIPLWIGKNSSRRRSEQFAEISASRTVTAVVNREISAAEKTLNEWEESVRRIALYRDTLLPKSIESVQATEKAYAAGAADFLSLIDALRLKLRIELDVAGSIAAYHKARAAMAALTGRRL